MPIASAELLARRFDASTQRYGARDTMLYALGLGLGTVPDELRYVYEDGLQALPTQAVTLCWAPTSTPCGRSTRWTSR